jgi:hypothetical protein
MESRWILNQLQNYLKATRNGDKKRHKVITVNPYFLVMVEKGRPGKAPFQLIWEYRDAGYLQIEAPVPQGQFTYQREADRRYHLRSPG